MKRFLLIIVVLISLVLLTGCQSKNPAKDIQNIKITVDQQTLNEVNQGIQNFKNGN